MARVKLDQETLGLSVVLEKITHARIKHCFKENDVIYFVVAPGDLGKAVGKGGSMIQRVQAEIGKRVRVIEFRENVVDFVKNVIYPLSVEEIVEEGNAVLLKDPSKKTKGLLIGRDSKHLIFINKVVGRFFDKEVKVV